MDKTEVAKIITSISAMFPNYKLSETEMKQTINAWHFVLEDFKYMDINNALLLYVRTSGSAYPPSAPQLIAMTQKPVELTELNPIEAWTLVQKAVKRSIYYAESEFEKIKSQSEAVAETVGSPEQLRAWATSSEETLETVIASSFQKTYRATLERRKQFALMPDNMKAIVQNTVSRLELQGE